MGSQRILIIDDEANQRLMLAEALRVLDAGYLIETAADGHAGLVTLTSDHPDLVITDYHMPAMDGLEFIAQLRARGMNTRIILITAYSSPELFAAAQQLDVDYCLTKPVPLALLRRVAQAALNP